MRRARVIAVSAFGMAGVLLSAFGALGSQTTLGIQKEKFTINGKPTFLLGISYYGALGAPKEMLLRDLEDMRKYGFNWMRVWATWSAFDNDISAVAADGKAREPYMSKLKWLIAECDRRGMIVDVTLARRGKTPRLDRAARSLVVALRPYRNWYLDMANERNVRDDRFVSFKELAAVIKTVRSLDRDRLVTASHAGDIGNGDLQTYLLDLKIDFIAPHRPRNAGSARRTGERTRRYLEKMRELGRVVPVHYQEPFRRGWRPDRWEPKAEDFLTDLRQAMEAGAAGWCFHNGDQKNRPEGKPRRSFDMRRARLFDQLDNEERKFLDSLRRLMEQARPQPGRAK